MKKILLITLLFMSVKGFAQITLEYTFSSPVVAAEVAPNEWNYYNVTYSNSYYSPYTVTIYGIDHALITSFTTTGVQAGLYTSATFSLTKGLFTSDTSDYAFESISGIANSSTDYGLLYDVETSSGVVLQVDSVSEFSTPQIFNSQNGTKLLLDLTYGTTQIYSLPGTYAAGIARPQGNGSNVNNAFPNPTADVIHLPYTLNGTDQGELDIVNISGQILKQYKVTSAFSDILLNTNALPKGSYLYYLTTDGVRSEAKQFVVQ